MAQLTSSQRPPPPLSLLTKVSFGIGDLGLALTTSMLGLLFAKFLTDTVGLSPSLVAVAIFVARTWDWANDPILGYLSDRTRTRWGKRRPYLLFGAIPFGVAFMLLWWSPPITSPAGLLVYYLAAYFFFDVMVTVVFIPYVALTPAITRDYDQRTALTGYRMFFSLVGSLLGAAIPLWALGGAAVPPEKRQLLLAIGAGMGLLAALPFWITFLGTREIVEAASPQEQPNFIGGLRAMRANKPYLMAALIYLLTVSGFEVLTGTSLYFLQYSVQRPELADKTTVILFGAALVGIPFWTWLSRRLDKVNSYVVAMVYLSAILLVYIALRSSLSPLLLYGFTALAGFGVSAGQTLPWAILPDTVEYGEYLSGQRNEGMYYSLMTLARKVASSVTLPAVLLLFDWAGYIPNQAQQTNVVQTVIAYAFGGIPALCFSAAALVALRYPLHRRQFEAIKAELEKRRTHPTTPIAIEPTEKPGVSANTTPLRQWPPKPESFTKH